MSRFFLLARLRLGLIISIFAAFLTASLLHSQTLTWDGNTSSPGVQNGNGNWNSLTANTNWWDGAANTFWTNSATAIANIGMTTPAASPTITLTEDIMLKELRLLAVTTGTIATGQQYTITADVAGRTLNFGTNGLIQMEDRSSGGSQFVSLAANLRLAGENLRIQKFGSGTTFQYITLGMTTNPNLIGNFTIAGSIYATIASNTTLGAVDRILVEAGGSAVLSGTVNYAKPMSLAGFGNSLTNSGTSYGAIRFVTNGTIVSGDILLTADAGVHSNFSGANGTTGLVISGNISDGDNSFAFHRFAFTRGNGTLTLSGTNTYNGATVLGRALAGGYSGGITILDFNGATAPQNNILYNNQPAPGALNFIGGNSVSVLRLAGKAGQTHNQWFGNMTVAGTHSALELLPGAGGTMNMSVGTITHTDPASTLSITGTASGALTTTQPAGFVGSWLSYTSGDYQRSWARVVSGAVASGYIGDTTYATGESLSAAPYSGASNLGITSASTGPLTMGAGVTTLNTISMADYAQERTLQVGTGQTLRLGLQGGIQLVSGARGLTLGALATTGVLTAGGNADTASPLFLSNHTSNSLLTVNAKITNNGTGAVTLVVNGAPGSRTVLTNANTHTGGTQVSSGILEVRNNGALGTSGNVTVVDGATLALSGGVTLSRALVAIGGFGDGGNGAIRSMSGDNIITGAITQNAMFLIAADAGASLTINSTTLTFSSMLTWGGAGTITVNSPLIGAGAITKQGTGLLTLAGTNTLTGGITVSGGTLRMASAAALGATSGVIITPGGTVDLNGQSTDRSFISMNGNGTTGNGALINNSATTSTIAGTTTATAVLAGPTVIGGSGNITFNNAGGLTGNVLLTKVGTGTLTFASTAASVRTGSHQIDAGTLRIQAATVLATTGTGSMTLNGGTLSLGFNATGTLTNVVNVMSGSTIVADRATAGDGGLAFTLSTLTIGGSKLTVKAGDNVSNGTIGLTLGAVSIGGAAMLPGNPTFDVQSTAAAATTLTLGAISDQAIAARTLTFQNSGSMSSSVNLGAAATSLVNGTLVNLASTGGSVTMNLNVAGALGTLAQVSVGSGNILNLGAAQTLGSLTGDGSVRASGAFALTVGNPLNTTAYDTTFSGTLENGTGTLALTKAGLSTLTLSGTNFYTGATIVSAGTLKLGSSTALGGTSAVTISAGGTLDLNGQTTDRNFTSISGTGINSGGALINSSTNLATITGNVALAAVSTLGGAGDILIDNLTGLTGAVQLTKVGAGTLTVKTPTLTNTRSGANRIEEGTLRIESNSLTAVTPIGASGLWTLNGGTLSLGLDTANALISGAITVLNNATVVTDVATPNNPAVTHTMTGVTIGTNTLTVKAGDNVAAGGIQGMTFGAVTLNGDATFDVQNSAAATTRLTTLALSDQAVAPRTITFTNTGSASTTSLVTLGTLAASLVDGTVVNINSGDNAGVNVNMNVVGALGGLSQVNVNGSSTLTTGITSVVLGGLGGNGTVNASGAFNLIVGNGSNSTPIDSTFSGVLANGAGTLTITKAGLGTWTLDGATSNTHSGLTTVNTGTLVLAKTGGAVAMSGGLTIGVAGGGTAGNATVRLGGNDQLLGTVAPLTMNVGSTLDLNGYNLTVLTFSSGNGLTVTGAGTLAISQTGGTLTFTGSSNIYSNLQLTTNVNSATRTMAVSTVADVMHISGNITQGSVNGSIAAGNSGGTAVGTLIFSGNNSYVGATTIQSGILNIRSASALGTVLTGSSVIGGATLQIQGGITTLAEALTLAGSGFVGANGLNMQTGALVNVSGTNNYAGLVSIATSAATISSDSGMLNLTNPATTNGAVGLTLAGAGDGSISSVLGVAITSLTKNGTGTWTLKGVNISTSPININAGTLKLGDGVTGRYSSTPALTYTGSGTFEFGGSTAASTQALGALTLSSGGGTLQVDAPASGTNGVTFTSLVAPVVGSGLNIVSPANTSVTISGTSNTNGIVDARLTYNGADFAASTAGVIGAAATTTASASLTGGNASPYLISGSFAQTSSVTANAGLKFNSSSTFTLNDGVLLTVNNGADTAGGLLITGGAAVVIANQGSATGLTTAGAGDLVVRTNTAADSLDIQAPITSSTTGGLTKNGLGTLTLSVANAYTGATTVNAGTLILGNAAAMSTSAALVRVGAVLDLNGQTITNAATLNGAGSGSGALINNSATPATIGALTIGLGNGTGGIGASIGGTGDITSTGILVGDGMLVKTGAGTLTLGDSAGAAQASLRSGIIRIDAGTLRVSNSSSALGAATSAVVLNGGTLSLGSAASVNAHPASITASSTIVSDVYTAGAGLTHTLGVMAIGAQTLTVTAGSNVTTAATNAGVTFGNTTLLGSPTFDVQSPTTATGGTTTLTLGALNDQGVAKTITFANTGASATNSIVTLGTAITSLIDGTVVNVNNGTNAGVTLNLNIAGALGTLAQVNLGANSVLNLGAAQTLGSLSGSGNVTGAFILTVGNVNSGTAHNTTYSGVFGAGGVATGLTKNGLGTLTLSGTNLYTGATVVSGGILKLNSAGALGATSGVTINTVGAVDLNGQTTNRNFVGVNGPGVSGGGAIINSSGTTGVITGNVVLTGHSSLGGAGNITINNTTGVTGNFQLTKVGAGTLTIIDTLTTSARTGLNRIDAGTLRLESASLTAVSPLGTSGAWLLNGGTLSLGLDTANALMTGAITLTNNATVVTDVATPGNAAVTHTMGALTFSSQTLTVRAGGNVIAGGTQGMTFGGVTLNGAATFDVQNTATVTTRLTLGALSDLAIAPRTITFANTGAATTNSLVTLGTAAGSLVDGTEVNVNNGTNAGVTLNLTGASALGTLAKVNVNGNSIITLGAAQTFGSLAGSGTVNASGVFLLTVGNTLNVSAPSTTFSGSLANGTGTLALTKNGLGTLTLSGTNSYSGATIVSGGILKLGSASALGATTLVTVGAGATLDLAGQSTDRNLTFSGVGHLAGGALINSSLTTSTLTGTTAQGAVAKIGGVGNIIINNAGGFTGSATLTKTGAGTFTVISTTTSVRTGTNQIDEGTFRVQAATAINPVGTGNYAMNGGTLSLGFDVSNPGINLVNVLSSGTIIVDRATSGAGGLLHNLGALQIGGSTLTVKAGSNVTSGTMALTLGTTSIGGPALVAGNPTFDVQSSDTATTTLTLGAISDQAIAPRTITFQNSGTTPSNVVLGLAAGSLVDGTVVNLASTGGAITVNLNNATALGSFARMTVGTGNTLALGASQTMASLSGAGTVTATAPAVLTIGNILSPTVSNSVFTGSLAGGANLSVIKAGAGSLTLGGASTFSGGLTVNAGSVILANSSGSATGSGPVTFQVGTTLSGAGRIEAAAGNSVSLFGTLEVGTSTTTAAQMAILTGGSGTLFIDGSGALVFNIISGAGEGDSTGDLAAADRLTIGGTMTVMSGATLRVDYSGAGTWAAGDQWRLFDWSSVSGSQIGAFTDYELPELGGDLTWDVSQLNTTGILAVSLTIPEPSRALLLVLAGMTLVLRRRRSGGVKVV